ncbi:MAG: stage II sporulation protein R [Clostridium sp.]|nr:stage II sporulation protein R [Clostridium sp.]
MKKHVIPTVITVFIVLVLLCEMIIGFNTKKVSLQCNKDELIEDISSKIIRFHVIANSDGELDQNLKLKVRDEVLKYIQPLLKDSYDINQSREILKEKDEKIIEIAKKVITENGYDYKVETTLTKENFPVKTYGNITLPQGEYEAYRIIIGSGEGHNWWCVMFPPICFVDITKGEVAYEETEKEMGRVLSEEELRMIENKIDLSEDEKAKILDTTEDNEVVVKFKIGEMFKSLFK